MADTAASPSKRHDTKREQSPIRPPRTSAELVHKHSKRLTPSFPILLPSNVSNGDPALSPKYSSPADSTRSSPRLVAQPPSPTDPSSFLTTLAAQERRVLELREELQRAERDLSILKKHWATIEANRKKTGLRQVEQLQPLSTTHLAKTDVGGEVPTPLTAEAYEKLTAKPARKPQQRVFSGSRHARTLSLLTSAKADDDEPISEFDKLDRASSPTKSTESNKQTLSRSSTGLNGDEGVGFGRTYQDLAVRRSMPPPSTEAFMKTGKQMASDIREGLWTFLEDIRQATVGEEGISGTESRASTSTSKAKAQPKRVEVSGHPKKKGSNSRLAEPASARPAEAVVTAPGTKADQSFWKEFGVDTPGRSRSPQAALRGPKRDVLREQRNKQLVDLDDNWDAWGSPENQPRASASRPRAEAESITASTGGALPWPELTKLTPSKLTRTVSDLMKDWDHPGSPNDAGDMEEQVLNSQLQR